MQVSQHSSFLSANRSMSPAAGSQQANGKPSTAEEPPVIPVKQPTEPIPAVEIKKKIKEAITYFNDVFKPKHLEFKLHEDSGKYFVQLINGQTKEVIRQTPSEDFLDMVAESKENSGLLVDERV